MTKLIRFLGIALLAILPMMSYAGYPNYHSETIEDLRVKVMGGHVGVQRTWHKGAWRFNRNWEPLTFNIDPLTGKPSEIERGSAVYKRADTAGTIFKNAKRKTIRVLTDGFLWSNLDGQWIQYDDDGRIKAYGNKNNVKVSFQFNAGGKIEAILDHFDTPVITYTYDLAGRIDKITDLSGREATYEYDTAGRLTAVIDVRNQRWEYGYTTNGDQVNLASISDPLNRTKRFTYNAAGVLKSIRYNDNTGIDYYYRYGENAATKNHSIVTIQSTSGVQEIRQYNESGRLVRKEIGGVEVLNQLDSNNEVLKTDKNGNKTTRKYDGYFNTTKISYADGSTKTYQYKTISSTLGLTGVTVKSNLSLKTQETDERGVVTRYVYDAKGNLARMTQAADTQDVSITEYSYDTYGNVSELTQVGDTVTQEAVWAYEYDDYGNVTKATDPENAETEFTYNVLGQVLILTDALDHNWVRTYDPRGNLLSRTDPLQHSKHYQYDGFGNLQSYTDESEVSWGYDYDARNNLIQITDPLSHQKTFNYNDDNLLTEISDELGHKTYFQYDGLNRLVATSDESGYTVRQYYDDLSADGGNYNQPDRIAYPSYAQYLNYDARNRVSAMTDKAEGLEDRLYQYQLDAAGNLQGLTDPIDAVTSLEYDQRDNLSHSTSAGQSEVAFSYDARDQLINLSDPNQQDYGFNYDRLGRTVSETRPMGEASTITYDALGNRISVQDSKNQLIKYSYDDALRLVTEEHFAAATDTQAVKTINYSYDARGLMTGWDDSEFSAVMAYDELGRKLSETVDYGDFDLGFAYSYYANGLRRTYTAPNGDITTYIYDNANRLQSLSVPAMGAITVSQYHNNRPAEILFPGGMKRTLIYNDFMQVTDITLTNPADQVISNQQYSYRPDGQIQSYVIDGVTKVYGYDEDKRLTQVEIDGVVAESFEYDAAGNRTRLNGGDVQWQYNANNELLASDFSTYEYDDNGNLVEKDEAGEVTRYLYDEINRLKEIRRGDDSLVAGYQYDPFNRRLVKRVGGVATHFVYSNDGMVAEAASSGSVSKGYEYWFGSPWSSNPIYQKYAGGFGFYENDRLFTPRKMLSGSGEVLWHGDRLAFGESLGVVDTVKNNLGFSGQYFDMETGLNYNWNRYYDLNSGRYITLDPLGILDGPNMYTYVNSDSINFIDPTGEFLNIVFGAAANAAFQFGTGALLSGGDLGRALRCIDLTAVGVAGVTGGLGGPGLFGTAYKAYKHNKRYGAFGKAGKKIFSDYGETVKMKGAVNALLPDFRPWEKECDDCDGLLGEAAKLL
ncbi:MAG: hypothetical protein MI976_12805 [Pseudomonadales bacterium]|nr:hypothetical protein [Pseudomonadales bacterium]